MMRTNPQGKRNERGVVLILSVIALVFLIPIVGLAIDVGYMYAVKTRLQSAVDGAALAAARALTLGQTTQAQAASARQNAVNWFYANFPQGNWATTNTMLDSSSVQVFDDPGNPNLRNVTVSATTHVPTWFMRWFDIDSTVISSMGNASRRDVVMMIVLDRSGSMNLAPGDACGQMKTAAKLFTGQFAPGRDRIGLVSFSDGVYVHSSPTTDFQNVLGYSNSLGNSQGKIDSISCLGGTNTASALSIAYNELYKMALPGALNLVLFETDGLPNSLTLNFWDPSSNRPALSNASGCQDRNNRTVGAGGWNSANAPRDWITSTYSMNTGGTGFMPDIQPGTYGVLYSGDTSAQFLALGEPWHASGYNYGLTGNHVPFSNTPGCGFSSSGGRGGRGGQGNMGNISDFAWIPATDIFGNQVNPANAYKPVQMSGGHLNFGGTTYNKWVNYRNGAFNATDNAAYRARTNGNLPISFFVIGLGGYQNAPPDLTLLQRIANDPNGDSFNQTPAYPPCAQNPNCIYYPSQPKGQLVYSTDANSLSQAFLALSSQVLRLSQ